MIRRPPGSPLFPYPPLFRSTTLEQDLAPQDAEGFTLLELDDHEPDESYVVRDGSSEQAQLGDAAGALPAAKAGRDGTRTSLARSEEHTSELQSRQYLVCRLL